jgi:Xaa-Pro aminopeptidase
VVTVEPFLCRPGFGGVQVEDMVLVTDDGAERLSNAP